MCMYFSYILLFFFFKQKTAYEMRISDWSSDVCSSDLGVGVAQEDQFAHLRAGIGDSGLGIRKIKSEASWVPLGRCVTGLDTRCCRCDVNSDAQAFAVPNPQSRIPNPGLLTSSTTAAAAASRPGGRGPAPNGSRTGSCPAPPAARRPGCRAAARPPGTATAPANPAPAAKRWSRA